MFFREEGSHAMLSLLPCIWCPSVLLSKGVFKGNANVANIFKTLAYGWKEETTIREQTKYTEQTDKLRWTSNAKLPLDMKERLTFVSKL